MENKQIKDAEMSIEESNRYREFKGIKYKIIYSLGIIFTLFELIVLLFKPIDPYYLRSIHLFFVTLLVFILVPVKKNAQTQKITIFDMVCILCGVWVINYIIINFDQLIYRITTDPTKLDVVTSSILLFLILEMTRRLQGWMLPIVSLIFLTYALTGNQLPGLLWHKGYDFQRTMGYIFSTNGIFSIPLGVSATYVFMFILFGAFLQISGVTKLFIDLSLAVAGKLIGGPAKVAVIASALMGTISGSSVGNVVTSGTFTIPLIKSTGYSSRFAGGVEAVGSTGGQIMPPIMGAGAFIMAELLGIPYLAVASAALIPAILYFISVLVMIDFEAKKKGLKGLPKDQIPNLKKILKTKSYLLTPIIVLVFSLIVLKNSPMRAALYAMIAIVVISWFSNSNKMKIKEILDSFYLGARGILDIAVTTAVAGVVIGVMSLTGLGTRFSAIIMSYSGGSLILGLILAMMVAMVLGMGLPTVAAYAIAASIIAPGLIELGASPIGAHLFILYFASLSAITPPVAVASFAAAAIAKESAMKVAFTSMKLGLAAYIIPFMFVFGPSLLMDGSAVEIITTLVSSIVGIVAFSGFIQGWFINKVGIINRLLLLTVGILLIKPGILTDTLGFLILLIVLIQQSQKKKTNKIN